MSVCPTCGRDGLCAQCCCVDAAHTSTYPYTCQKCHHHEITTHDHFVGEPND